MSGIYLHIPFCKQACYYCDFHFSASLKRKPELAEALAQELILRKNEIREPLQTIYFGGGTPSILTIDELRFLMDTIYNNYQVSINPEITLEANPDDLSSIASGKKDKIKGLKDLGINRLSIGIQSFFDEDLQFMNRAHSSEEARNCLSLATQYFDNTSIDLIYGIPGLTSERWKKNLEIALSYNIPHISSYALTVEPRTALHNFIEKGKIAPLEDSLSKEHYLILLDSMKSAGYTNYEFSNFSKEGYFSINNTAYWQGKSYLGIGPSAHSFNGTIRSWNISNNIKYIKSINKSELPFESETLSISDRYNEYIMTGLRTMWGVSLKKIEKDFGNKYVDYLIQQIKKPIEDGMLKIISSENKTDKDLIGKIVITDKGRFLSDGIASNLFWID